MCCNVCSSTTAQIFAWDKRFIWVRCVPFEWGFRALCQQYQPLRISHINRTATGMCKIDQSHKSHHAPVSYPANHHSEQKCAHFCPEWCVMGYGTGALWDLWIWSISLPMGFPFPIIWFHKHTHRELKITCNQQFYVSGKRPIARVLVILYHYIVTLWAFRRLRSRETGYWLSSMSHKENIRTPHYCRFVRVTTGDRWTPFTKGPVTQKAFPWFFQALP